MLIIFDTPTTPAVVSIGVESVRIPAVTVEHPPVIETVPAVMSEINPTAIVTPAYDREVSPGYVEVVTPAETDSALVARMVALHVPPGAAYIVNPVLPDGVPPERWIVDWQSGTVSVAPPVVSINDVAVERARRLALGFNYDFGGVRGVHRIGTTDADMVGWGEVSTYAGALIDSGDLTALISIATDTGPCQVTAPEWRLIEVASAEFRQPLWAAAFVLMATSPIPSDYTNDSYWT